MLELLRLPPFLHSEDGFLVEVEGHCSLWFYTAEPAVDLILFILEANLFSTFKMSLLTQLSKDSSPESAVIDRISEFFVENIHVRVTFNNKIALYMYYV